MAKESLLDHSPVQQVEVVGRWGPASRGLWAFSSTIKSQSFHLHTPAISFHLKKKGVVPLPVGKSPLLPPDDRRQRVNAFPQASSPCVGGGRGASSHRHITINTLGVRGSEDACG